MQELLKILSSIQDVKNSIISFQNIKNKESFEELLKSINTSKKLTN